MVYIMPSILSVCLSLSIYIYIYIYIILVSLAAICLAPPPRLAHLDVGSGFHLLPSSPFFDEINHQNDNQDHDGTEDTDYNRSHSLV